MGIDYTIFMSNAPTVTKEVPFFGGTTTTFTVRAELPHETVAAVANLFTDDDVHITIQDVREYISVENLYSDAPDHTEEEGVLDGMVFWKIINENPKWSVIDALWYPGSSDISLGRRFGAHEILSDFDLVGKDVYCGSVVDSDVVRLCILAAISNRWNKDNNESYIISNSIIKMGFDGISWG